MNQSSGWAGLGPARPIPWADFFKDKIHGLGWAEVLFSMDAHELDAVARGFDNKNLIRRIQSQRSQVIFEDFQKR